MLPRLDLTACIDTSGGTYILGTGRRRSFCSAAIAALVWVTGANGHGYQGRADRPMIPSDAGLVCRSPPDRPFGISRASSSAQATHLRSTFAKASLEHWRRCFSAVRRDGWRFFDWAPPCRRSACDLGLVNNQSRLGPVRRGACNPTQGGFDVAFVFDAVREVRSSDLHLKVPLCSFKMSSLLAGGVLAGAPLDRWRC